jgi:hypothetical protein
VRILAGHANPLVGGRLPRLPVRLDWERFSRSEEACDPLGCGALHAGDDVGVGVEGDGDAGVTEAFLDDLGVDAGGERQGGGRVPEVVVVPTSAQPRLCRPPRYADLAKQ